MGIVPNTDKHSFPIALFQITNETNTIPLLTIVGKSIKLKDVHLFEYLVRSAGLEPAQLLAEGF